MVTGKLKVIVERNLLLYKLLIKLYYKYHTIKSTISKELSIHSDSRSCARIKKTVKGSDNSIYIGRNCKIDNAAIRIIGSHNRIEIGNNCRISQGCSFWIEGNNSTIYVGNNTSMNYNVHLCAQEDNVKIQIGDGCMLANNIIIRTSDSHPIYDIPTGKRINLAKSITLKENVWIAAKVTILKGVTIGAGSVIGLSSVVTKDIPNNSLAVGIPAKAVKGNIFWRKTFDYNEER